MLKVGLIIGSTRPNRFADIPAKWIATGAVQRQDLKLDVLDLREQNLPFFNESTAPSYNEGRYSEPAAEAWRRKIGGYDAYIATIAEYNHGPTAVLKKPSTAPITSGTGSLLRLLDTAASVQRARSSSCAEWRSSCRWHPLGMRGT